MITIIVILIIMRIIKIIYSFYSIFYLGLKNVSNIFTLLKLEEKWLLIPISITMFLLLKVILLNVRNYF